MHFPDVQHLNTHREIDCKKVRTTIPKQGEILKFKHFKKNIMVPFIIYADFECLVRPINHRIPDLSKSSTTKVALHSPCAFGYYIKYRFNDNESKYVHHTVENNCAIAPKSLLK
jgi:hypothetical protein